MHPNVDFETHLPIQLDATCNGFQHLALLCNERSLFKTLNLTSKEPKSLDNKPEDFYTYILLLVKKYLKDNPDLECNKRLTQFGFDRSHIKKLTMTIPYNSTQTSQIKYLKEALFLVDQESLLENYPKEEFNKDLNKVVNIQWFSKYENLEYSQNYVCTKDLRELIKIIFKIITTEFNKINKLNKYLKIIAKTCSLLNVPIN
jgi:DNA-directed RNA polymerase